MHTPASGQMQSKLECIPCFVRQALSAARMVSEDSSVHERVLRRVLSAVAQMDLRISPPAMAAEIYRIICESTGESDPYRRVKEESNALALSLLPDLRRRVSESTDPLATAIRLSIAGNVIDFGVSAEVTDQQVRESIEWSFGSPLHPGTLAAFRVAIESAQAILYLADNAGEIVLDRLLLERLPTERVVLVVRGQPVINDATLDDAVRAGVSELVQVIDNGSNAPGTILDECSDELRRAFAQADLVIAKGQGNYESLNEEARELYFLFKAKCPVAARGVDREVGDLVFARSAGGKLVE